MRALIVLLVLCNAALLAWGLTRPPAPAHGPPPPGGNLVLLSEVKQEPAAPAAQSTAAPKLDAEPPAEEPVAPQAVPGTADAQQAADGDAADPSATETTSAAAAEQGPDPVSPVEETGSVPAPAASQTQPEPAGTPAPAEADIEAAPQPPSQPAQSAAATGSPPVAECQILTPTLRPRDARRLAASWRRQGFDVAVELVTERQRLGYWVYLPPVPSLDEARQTMDRLRRAGIEDYALVGGGGATNIVSLGLFDRRSYAERRLQQMRGLGFAARMGERDRQVSAARLSLRPGEQDLPPAPEGWTWQEIECPSDAEPSAALAPVPPQ